MPKVLVVDDSRAIRTIVGKIFAMRGYEVLQAENGAAALLVLDQCEGVSVICVDCNMPGMSGVEMTRRLRGTPRTYRIPIIMITTETHSIVMQAAMQAGVNEYVMKPFNTEAIIDKLRILNLSCDLV